MSLHIYLIHNYENRRGLNPYSLDFMFRFISYFSNEIKPLSIKFIQESEEDKVLINQKYINSVEEYFKLLQKVKIKDLNSISVHLDIDILKQSGIFILHNSFYSNIYGDIEIDIYSNDRFNSMAELIKNNQEFKDKLNKFFYEIVNEKSLFRRVYIDETEEGEEDPLDRVYEYDIEKHKAVKNMIKLIEVRDEYVELDENMRGYDRELISSWIFDNFKDVILDKAKRHRVNVNIASFYQFSTDKKNLKNFYDDCIKEILIPIFMVQPISERIKQHAIELKSLKEK